MYPSCSVQLLSAFHSGWKHVAYTVYEMKHIPCTCKHIFYLFYITLLVETKKNIAVMTAEACLNSDLFISCNSGYQINIIHTELAYSRICSDMTTSLAKSSDDDAVSNITNLVSELCMDKGKCNVSVTADNGVNGTMNHIDIQYECKQTRGVKAVPIMEDKINRLWHNQEKKLSIEDVKLALETAEEERHKNFDRSLQAYSANKIFNRTISIKSAATQHITKDTREAKKENSEIQSLVPKMSVMIIIGSTLLIAINLVLMVVLIKVYRTTNKDKKYS